MSVLDSIGDLLACLPRDEIKNIHNAANNGKIFEEKTTSNDYLIHNGFFKKKFYVNGIKKFYLKSVITLDDTQIKIINANQNNFNAYIFKKLKITPIRVPDEAYIIKQVNHEKISYIIKILEKKFQNVDGSVETKIWAGPALKREYELIFGEKYNIQYAFTVNDFLKKKLVISSNSIHKKKYEILCKILEENNIPIFYGDDLDYLDKLNGWILNFTKFS